MPGDVEIVDGRIARVGLSSANGSGVASPGFVDLQVNGFGGVDFLDADAAGYRVAGEALLETGVTAYLPTFITAPEEQLVAALTEVPNGSEGPHVLGAHLEGPFLAPERLGTHPESARRDPDTDLLERLLAAGPVRLVTLAPELPGADELIDLLQRARRHGLLRSHGCERARGECGLRPRRAHGHAPLQRDAAVQPPRSRHCRRSALARRRHRPGDPRRHSPRPRHRQAHLERQRRARRSRDRLDGRRGQRRRLVQPGRVGVRAQGRRGPRPGRCPRRQLADDDRGGSQPPQPRRPARRRARRRHGRAVADDRAPLGGPRRRAPADVVVLDDNLEVDRVLVGGELSGVA